ncbi:uncharacterized protein [Palaemon carinicauda]|uniref:uncharacterized protein n=1 Tax=Palaemon carinicauda TaxID=392227 RepID=UPI0035B628E7
MAKLLKPSRLDTDPSSSNAAKEWKHWHRIFTNFIEESGDAAPDKLRALVNCVSSSVYELIEDCSTFESAIAKLDSVYVKLPNEIFARHVLATRRQQSGESIDEFLRELHKLSKDCNFQPVTAEQYRQELVRDAFINGIASVFIRQRLLENKSLNLETAHSQARTLDLAQRSADAYAPPPVPHTAALVPERQAQPTGDQQQHPTQEGGEGSSPGGSAVAAAYLSKRKCYFCGNALHSTGSTTATLYNPTLLAITATYPNNLSHAATNITVNGHSLKALVDSCSSDSFIREEVAQRLNLTVVPASSAVSMASKSFNASSPGFVIADLVHLDQRYPCIQLGVPKDLCCDVILGYDFQKQHQREKTKFEDNWRQTCIIEPSISPWRAQVVVVKDPLDRHKKRLCIDYSQTINQYTELDAYPLPRIEDMVHDLAKYKVFSTFDLKSAYHQISIKESERKYTAFEGGASQAEHDENVQNVLEVVQKRNLTLNEGKSVISVPTINVLGYCVGNNVIKPDPDRLRPLQELPPPTNMGSLRRAQGLFAYYAKWIPGFSDTIHPLVNTKTFPLSEPALAAFNSLKKQLMDVSLRAVDESLPFVVECYASEVAVSAVLNQGGRPVAFMSRTLQGSELHYPAVEKEATAIIEAVRKWSHFLARRHFTLITDQRSVMFMLDSRKRTKIKNNKIQEWRLELASYSYTIQYRPGKQNIAPDTLTLAYCCSISSMSSLTDIHENLCHPGVTRLLHFVRSKNLPFSTDDVKRVCASCRICAQQKPKFHRPGKGVLIKATQPMERLSIDFKGPLPSTTSNKYILTVVDEYSRFPFVFPCPNMHSKTVIKCLESIFILCGMPSFIHSDQGASFMSQELKLYLSQKGVATSRTTPYHPMGNGQVERYNGIIWKSICLVLESRGLKTQHWEIVLPEVLHSVRSLLCIATDETPHERFFRFQRRSSLGSTLPSWLLTPGPVLLRRHVRSSKHEPSTEEVQLMDANSMYANVKYPDGRESTVSTRDLAPSPAGATSPVHHVEPSGETESPDTTEVQDTQTHDNRDCHESRAQWKDSLITHATTGGPLVIASAEDEAQGVSTPSFIKLAFMYKEIISIARLQPTADVSPHEVDLFRALWVHCLHEPVRAAIPDLDSLPIKDLITKPDALRTATSRPSIHPSTPPLLTKRTCRSGDKATYQPPLAQAPTNAFYNHLLPPIGLSFATTTPDSGLP